MNGQVNLSEHGDAVRSPEVGMGGHLTEGDGTPHESLTPDSPLLAWQELNGRRPDDAHVTLIKPRSPGRGGRLHVFRIDGLIRDQPVAAIRGRADRLLFEARLFSDLLPGIGVDAPRSYGALPERASPMGWHFVEFLSEVTRGEETPSVRCEVAEWLGRLHRKGADAAGAGLPRRSAQDHLAELAFARSTLAGQADLLRLSGQHESDVRAVEVTLGLLGDLERQWPRFVAELDQIPRSVVHGDLKRANLGRRASDRSIVPFDWEYAAIGSIALDLGASGFHRDRVVVYLKEIGQVWSVTESQVQRFTVVGEVLRGISSLTWLCQGLGELSIRRVSAQLEFWNDRLSDLLGTLSIRVQGGR